MFAFVCVLRVVKTTDYSQDKHYESEPLVFHSSAKFRNDRMDPGLSGTAHSKQARDTSKNRVGKSHKPRELERQTFSPTESRDKLQKCVPDG